MMNPGWKQDGSDPFKYFLVEAPDIGLTDLIVKEKIFNFFMYLGCVPLSKEHRLMQTIMTDDSTHWKKPIEVKP